MGQDFEKQRRTKKPSVTKTPRGNVGKPPRVEWVGFVAYEPTQNDKAALDALMARGVDPLDGLDEVVLEGVYDVKVSWDSRNDCYRATIYCGLHGHRHAGYALSARGGTAFGALRRALFIHAYVLEGEWGVESGGSGWKDDNW